MEGSSASPEHDLSGLHRWGADPPQLADVKSVSDTNRGGRRAAAPDQPLELVDVDLRNRKEGRLSQLVPERYQPLCPPAQNSEIVVEPAPLAVEGVELVHDSAASVAAVGAHRSRKDSAGRFGEAGAGDLELDLTPACADPCSVAISDLQLPAGEMQQLEQERASTSVGDQLRCHAAKPRARGCVRPVWRLSLLEGARDARSGLGPTRGRRGGHCSRTHGTSSQLGGRRPSSYGR